MKKSLSLFVIFVGVVGFFSSPFCVAEKDLEEINPINPEIMEEDEDFDDTFSMEDGMGSLMNLAKDMQDFTNIV